VTDSVASIPASRLTPVVEVVDLYVNDGERNEADRAIDLDDFYRRLADMKHLPTSSQPSVEALVDAFKHAVERGCDVVGVFISEKMSKTNSMQEGFAALAAARAAEAGETVERCAQAAAETIRRTKYLFTPHTLEYLVRGGRIGTASAFLGQLLQIRPILCVRDGVTAPFSKVRTQSRALSEMARVFADDVRERGLRDVVVHYISDRATAEKFAREVIDPIAGFTVEVVPVSPVIGLHVGPAVAIAYETEREVRW
jgi:fatty acid-binding protein DegV